MPKPCEILSASLGGDVYTVGQRVCFVGRGMDAPIHNHGTVKRFTATMMVVNYRWRTRFVPGGEIREGEAERRYRLSDGRQVGGHDYGGTSVSAKCQRPKPKTEGTTP